MLAVSSLSLHPHLILISLNACVAALHYIHRAFMESGTTAKKQLLDFDLLWRILRLANPYRFWFRVSIGLSLTLAFIAPFRPKIVQFTVDNYITHYNFSGLQKMALLLLA